MGQPQVDKNGQFDHGDQDKGQGHALFHNGDNKENGNDAHCIYHLEVVVRSLDHVFHAGRLPYEHAAFVIFFQNIVQGVDLAVHLVAGHFVFRIDQHQFPFVAFQDAGDGLGQDFLRHQGTNHGFQSQDIFHSFHLLHLPHHLADVSRRHICIDQKHMSGRNIEFFLELGISDHIFHILWQAFPHVVVDFAVGSAVAIIGRGYQQDEHRQEYGEYFYRSCRKFSHVGNQGSVFGLLEGFIQYQDQGGQHGNTSQDAQ